MRWTRGLFRVWLVASILWALIVPIWLVINSGDDQRRNWVRWLSFDNRLVHGREGRTARWRRDGRRNAENAEAGRQDACDEKRTHLNLLGLVVDAHLRVACGSVEIHISVMAIDYVDCQSARNPVPAPARKQNKARPDASGG